MQRSLLLITMVSLFGSAVFGQSDASDAASDLSGLPGYIDEPAGSLHSMDMPLKEGPECQKYRISVPENRTSKSSRNIRLYFYRFQARKPSGRAPVFFLPVVTSSNPRFSSSRRR